MKASFRKFADGKDHLVPLSTQAIKLLEIHRKITGHKEFVFGSYREKYERPISSATMLSLLYKLGYKDKMTVHGFRSLASTHLHENYPGKTLVIEKQLSHSDSNASRKPYNNAEYLPFRREMMQFWADLIDLIVPNAIAFT